MSSALNMVFKWLKKWVVKERKKFIVAEYHEYEETDNIDSVGSSLK